MPPLHLATTFLGQPCGTGSTHGVNPEMHERLAAAENAVRAAYDKLPPEDRVDPSTGASAASFERWVALRGPFTCWRPNAGPHSAGAAIDLDSASNPYIVTRTGGVAGGEPGGERLTAMRERALAAYDRAVRFAMPSASGAELMRRRPNESTASVWERFMTASEALAAYLSVVADPAAATIARVAIEDADALSDDELLAAIPEGERTPLARSSVPRDEYLRILRDYENARIPLTLDAPSAAPEVTRNPARGFLRLRCEIVTALCDQGLRWGACDFDLLPNGSSHNGAMAHFDLADSGGYPEINSLLRFG